MSSCRIAGQVEEGKEVAVIAHRRPVASVLFVRHMPVFRQRRYGSAKIHMGTTTLDVAIAA